jgi:hypothetical protein
MTLVTTEEFLIASPGEPVINITAFTARQQASGYVGSHISHLLAGMEPALIFSQKRLVWRVPIVLATPQRGRLGEVGYLDIDARTDQLLITPDFIEQIKQHAQTLAESSTL